METKPWITHYYEGEYPCIDARLHVEEEHNIVIEVEYPDPTTEPDENWADVFVGLTLEDVAEYYNNKGVAYLLMKDCW